MQRTGVVQHLLRLAGTAQNVQPRDHAGGHGDDQLRHGAVVLLGQIVPLCQQFQRLCPAGGLEAGVGVAGAALRVGGVHGHLAGQQALLQRGVGLHRHAQLLAGGQQLLFNAAGQQAVLFLNDVQLAVAAVAPDDIGSDVGSTDGADLALLLQLHHGFHGLFQRVHAEVRALPVGVQHVQMVGVQTAQAVLHVLDDALGGEVAVHLYPVHYLVQDGRLVPPLQAALGGKHHLVAVDVLHGLAHHFLAVVQPVDGCSVDPLDALLHGGLDGLYGQGIVVIAPPCTAADGPCTHAQKRHGDAAFANVDILHIFTLHASSVPRNGNPHSDVWHTLLCFFIL